MPERLTIGQVVDAVESAVLAGVDAILRESGMLQAPTVHMLAEDLDQPYVGSVTCRSFHRGADAAIAVAELGRLPSVLATTRIVVAWERQDLYRGLEIPVGDDDMAVMVADAALDGVLVHRYPLRIRQRPGAGGGDGVDPEWGRPVQQLNPELPAPITRLLDVWRHWSEEDVNETVLLLEAAGYRVRWMAR